MPSTISNSNYLRPRVGVSSCLLGNQVRYDGGHKHDRYITGTLSQHVDLYPVCPEVECGMPVPREAMRLVGDPESPRLLGQKSSTDFTQQMVAWAAVRVKELEAEDLSGFIFKSKSPSSGMERVKVYPEGGGSPVNVGVGLFARAFMEHFPLVPAEEDGRLHDPRLRENFLTRVFVFRRWQKLAADPGLGKLVDFHTRHKLLVNAHNQAAADELGRLVAHAKEHHMDEVLAGYIGGLMAALKQMATPRRHANVLLHAMGHFKDELTHDEKEEFLELVDFYKEGEVPLIVPVTLLNHFVRKYGKEYLAQQVYLHPHPLDLRVRSVV